MYIDMFVACMILSGKDQVRKGCAGDMKDNLEDYLVKLNDTDRKLISSYSIPARLERMRKTGYLENWDASNNIKKKSPNWLLGFVGACLKKK